MPDVVSPPTRPIRGTPVPYLKALLVRSPYLPPDLEELILREPIPDNRADCLPKVDRGIVAVIQVVGGLSFQSECGERGVVEDVAVTSRFGSSPQYPMEGRIPGNDDGEWALDDSGAIVMGQEAGFTERIQLFDELGPHTLVVDFEIDHESTTRTSVCVGSLTNTPAIRSSLLTSAVEDKLAGGALCIWSIRSSGSRYRLDRVGSCERVNGVCPTRSSLLADIQISASTLIQPAARAEYSGTLRQQSLCE